MGSKKAGKTLCSLYSRVSQVARAGARKGKWEGYEGDGEGGNVIKLNFKKKGKSYVI